MHEEIAHEVADMDPLVLQFPGFRQFEFLRVMQSVGPFELRDIGVRNAELDPHEGGTEEIGLENVVITFVLADVHDETFPVDGSIGESNDRSLRCLGQMTDDQTVREQFPGNAVTPFGELAVPQDIGRGIEFSVFIPPAAAVFFVGAVVTQMVVEIQTVHLQFTDAFFKIAQIGIAVARGIGTDIDITPFPVVDGSLRPHGRRRNAPVIGMHGVRGIFRRGGKSGEVVADGYFPLIASGLPVGQVIAFLEPGILHIVDDFPGEPGNQTDPRTIVGTQPEDGSFADKGTGGRYLKTETPGDGLCQIGRIIDQVDGKKRSVFAGIETHRFLPVFQPAACLVLREIIKSAFLVSHPDGGMTAVVEIVVIALDGFRQSARTITLEMEIIPGKTVVKGRHLGPQRDFDFGVLRGECPAGRQSHIEPHHAVEFVTAAGFQIESFPLNNAFQSLPVGMSFHDFDGCFTGNGCAVAHKAHGLLQKRRFLRKQLTGEQLTAENGFAHQGGEFAVPV